MNRTFLILLMITSAMLIAVLGQKTPTVQHKYTPWDTTRTESGLVKAFGITLGETTIKESEISLGKTPEIELLTSNTDSSIGQWYELVAIYKEVIISGVISELRLTYQLEQRTLQALYSSLPIKSQTEESYNISPELAAAHSSTAIADITYIPSINYGEEIIIQRFGNPEKEDVISDAVKKWLYPEIGLEIQLHANQSERFIYTNSKVN